jgi:hypothetical protein
LAQHDSPTNSSPTVTTSNQPRLTGFPGSTPNDPTNLPTTHPIAVATISIIELRQPIADPLASGCGR